MKNIQNDNWKNWGKSKKKTCNFLWWIISESFFSLFMIKHFATLALWTDQKKWKLFGEVWGDLMSALFLTITITQHFPQLQKDWSKGWSIRGRIAVDSQHQICIPAKFLFLYSSWNRFTKEWENIFADYHISGLSSEVWHFVTKIGQKSNHFGQNSPKLGKTPSRSRTAN